MSETAPRSNPRLDDFEANKAAHEREQFENELYADAGKGDFSDEARKRVEEADAYERHMEELAKRERTPLNDDNSAEAIRARIDASYKFDADHPESRAYDQEWDDAIAENDRHDADKMNEEFDAKAKADAIEAKIAADPKLRRMNYLAEQIAELRNKPVDENADDDIIRLKGLEDNLESYLSKYAESDDFDAELADLMIERSAAAPAAKENIITLPNPHLRQKSAKVKDITDAIITLINDMTSASLDWEDSRPHEISAALAAVQIDTLERVVIVRSDFEDKATRDFTALINPEIVKYEGEIISDYEGCLSVNNVYGLVPRHSKIRVKALDIEGNEVRFKAEGFLARVIQHEVDHTNGIVFIDHIQDETKAFYTLDEKGELQPLDYDTHVRDNHILWD